MSRLASGILLPDLSFELPMLGVTAWQEADRWADVRAWQPEEAATTADPDERTKFAEYAESRPEKAAGCDPRAVASI